MNAIAMTTDPTATLHTLNASPFEQPALANRLLRFASRGDGLLFIEDGVYAMQDAALLAAAHQAGLSLYALAPDLIARHLPEQAAVQTVDDAGFVALCCHYRKTVSWHS